MPEMTFLKYPYLVDKAKAASILGGGTAKVLNRNHKISSNIKGIKSKS